MRVRRLKDKAVSGLQRYGVTAAFSTPYLVYCKVKSVCSRSHESLHGLCNCFLAACAVADSSKGVQQQRLHFDVQTTGLFVYPARHLYIVRHPRNQHFPS